MKGRPKQPTAIAKIKGTYQPCRYEEGADKALSFVYNNIPAPPKELGKAGSKVWSTVLLEAQKVNGYISYIDLLLFTNYCEVADEIERIRTENPPLFVDKNGVEVPNPKHKYLRELRREYLELSREFGLSPASRSKIKIEQIEEPKQKEEEFNL